MLLRRVRLATRLFAIIIMLLAFTGGIVGFYFLQMQQLGVVATEQTGAAVMTGIEEKVQVATHSMAITLAVAVSGAQSVEEEHRILRDSVADIRFEEDESGYYFIYQGTNVITVPTNESLQGRDLAATADENGVFYVRELARAAAGGVVLWSTSSTNPAPGCSPRSPTPR